MCTLACVHHIYLSTVFTYSTGYHVIVDFNFDRMNLMCMFFVPPMKAHIALMQIIQFYPYLDLDMVRYIRIAV